MMNQTALVTGASMGLGEAFARALAARNINLLLVARGGDKLAALAAELAAAHGVRAEWLAADLSKPEAPAAVAAWIDGLGPDLSPAWLVNNAGFGPAGSFAAQEPALARSIVDVNCGALVELTARLLPALRRAPAGTARVLNIASVAAFQPIPWFAVYAASKALVLSFSEGLAEELRADGIRVTVVCPGPVKTNFGANNALDDRLFANAPTAAEVVAKALRASDAGVVVHQTEGAFLTFLQRFAPRAAVRRVAGMMVKRHARKLGTEV